MNRALSLCAPLLVLAACGDDVRREPVVAPVSGSRLKLEWFFYGDGSKDPNPEAFFDTELHTRCSPQLWSDGVLRCAPVADDAVYTNATCTELVGRGDQIAKPTFFLGHEQVAGVRSPAHLYHAGSDTTVPSSIYERIDGTCVGPRLTQPDVPYFEVQDEVLATDMVVFHDSSVAADERLDLEVRETDDGLHLPLGLRDRTLALACHAIERAGGAVCEPTSVPTAFHFADPGCETPALGVPVSQPAPAIARSTGLDGCTVDRAVGASAPVLYTRIGATCQVVPGGGGLRAYTLGAEISLAPLERRVVPDRAHRLLQIVIGAGSERLLDEWMYDTATRLDCRRATFDDAVRCIPAVTIPATTLFAQGCTLAIPVAELTEPACTPTGFATTTSELGVLELRAIGEPLSSPLYSMDTGSCAPYIAAPGRVVHAVGPPIPTETFVGGHAAGER